MGDLNPCRYIFLENVLKLPHLAAAAPELHAELEEAYREIQKARPRQETPGGRKTAPVELTAALALQVLQLGVSAMRPDVAAGAAGPGSEGPTPVGSIPTTPKQPVGASPADPEPLDARGGKGAAAGAGLKKAESRSGAGASSSLGLGQINAETLEQAAIEDFPRPAESSVDRIHFLINNLSMDNLDSKTRELTEHIRSDFFPWFSNYMVVKRVTQESNFQPLYLALLDRFGDSKLSQVMLKTTYHYIKILLAADRIRTVTGERTLLKNLGSWLGRLTLGRNRPVLFKELDLKGSILEAYEQGKMIAVIPFVHKARDTARCCCRLGREVSACFRF